MRPDEVPHTCNPSYLGVGDQKDCDLRPAWAKVSETPISTKKQGAVLHICHPSLVGGIGGLRPYLKNKLNLLKRAGV
jgi:hypothetical protein